MSNHYGSVILPPLPPHTYIIIIKLHYKQYVHVCACLFAVGDGNANSGDSQVNSPKCKSGQQLKVGKDM